MKIIIITKLIEEILQMKMGERRLLDFPLHELWFMRLDFWD